jgi:hypothetical protein
MNVFSFTPSQLKKRIHALAARPDDRFLDLATDLNALHGVATAAQFKETVRSVGLGSRKAYYLVELAKRLGPHMRSRRRLQRLGWTKCQMIGAQLPEGDFLELLQSAEECTAKELETRIRRNRSPGGTRCVLLYFTPAEYRRYEEAVLKCGARKRGRGLIDKEKATIKMAKKVLSA